MFTSDVSHDRFLTLMNHLDTESLHEHLHEVSLRALHEKLAASRVTEEAELYANLYKAKAQMLGGDHAPLFMVSMDQTVDCIVGGVRSNTPSWIEQHVKKLEGFTNSLDPQARAWFTPGRVPAGMLAKSSEPMHSVRQFLKMIGVN